MSVDNNITYLEKRTYKIEEIQKILGISRNTAYSLIKRKQFHSVYVCGGIEYQKRALINGLDKEVDNVNCKF